MQLWLVVAGMLSTLASPCQLPFDVLCSESAATFTTALLCQHCLQPHAAGLFWYYCRQLGVGKLSLWVLALGRAHQAASPAMSITQAS